MEIKYFKGDVLTSGADYIVHQVNCQGKMGSGLALQVKQKYPEVYKAYLEYIDLRKRNIKYFSTAQMLGIAQFVNTIDGSIIVNLFAQDKYGYDGHKYTNYEAFYEGLTSIANVAKHMPNAVVAFPHYIGCNRGGADWNVIVAMIESAFKNTNVTVKIYEQQV